MTELTNRSQEVCSEEAHSRAFNESMKALGRQREGRAFAEMGDIIRTLWYTCSWDFSSVQRPWFMNCAPQFFSVRRQPLWIKAVKAGP